MTYLTPATETENKIVLKKSRFIARTTKVQSKQEAHDFLARAKKDYPDARHHCWAYILGNPLSPTAASMNDDGEPSGTAGRPILNVIQHKKIGDIMVIIVRYFGGIKLGAGGLVRAYSGSTEKVIALLPTEQIIIKHTLTISLAFHQEQRCRHWAKQHQADLYHVIYSNAVQMTIDIPNNHLAAFHDFCSSYNIHKLTTEE